jgi:hypothetical protein
MKAIAALVAVALAGTGQIPCASADPPGCTITAGKDITCTGSSPLSPQAVCDTTGKTIFCRNPDGSYVMCALKADGSGCDNSTLQFVPAQP